jgi:hypothetical protein
MRGKREPNRLPGSRHRELSEILPATSLSLLRKSFSRAKQHLGGHRPRLRDSPDTQKQLLTAFLQAVQAGEMTAFSCYSCTASTSSDCHRGINVSQREFLLAEDSAT